MVIGCYLIFIGKDDKAHGIFYGKSIDFIRFEATYKTQERFFRSLKSELGIASIALPCSKVKFSNAFSLR